MEPRLYLHWLKNNELIEGRLKMHDLKMTDQVAWYENDGPSKYQGMKM